MSTPVQKKGTHSWQDQEDAIAKSKLLTVTEDVDLDEMASSSGAPGITDAPLDGKFYARTLGGWQESVVMDDSGSFDDSNLTDGVIYFVKDGDNFKVYFGKTLMFNGTSSGATGPVVVYPLLLGVVDGEIDFEEQTYTNGNGATHSVTDGDVTVDSNSSTYSRVNGIIDSNANEKMIVFKCQNIAGANEGSVRIYNKADTTEIDRANVTSYDTEERLVFTPDADGYAIRLYGSLGTAEAATKRYYDMAVYDVVDLPGYGEVGFDPLTCTLPLSGEAVDGNARKYQNQDTSTYLEPIATSADPNPLPTGDFVNVKDYGAVGDGVTDDTAAFAAALAVGDVMVPAGLYLLLHLIVPSNRTIQGVSKATSQLRINYATAQDHEACMDIYDKTNVTIKNLTFEMTPPWTFQGNAWTGKKCAYIRGAINFTMENVDCKNNEHGCFYIGASSSRRGNGLLFKDCNFINVDCAINSDRNTQYEGDDDVQVINCHFDGHYYSEPVFLDRSTAVLVKDCTAKNKMGGSAWRFDQCTDVTIDNCDAENMGNGVYIENCDQVDIKNSSFKSIRWAAIENVNNSSTNVTKTNNTYA